MHALEASNKKKKKEKKKRSSVKTKQKRQDFSYAALLRFVSEVLGKKTEGRESTHVFSS